MIGDCALAFDQGPKRAIVASKRAIVASKRAKVARRIQRAHSLHCSRLTSAWLVAFFVVARRSGVAGVGCFCDQIFSR